MQWGSHHDQTHLTYNQHTSKKKKKNIITVLLLFFFIIIINQFIFHYGIHMF